MTKEDINADILENAIHPNVLLELATGTGKTKNALDIVFKRHTDEKILIVVYRLVSIISWKDEITKWGYADKLQYITFTSYASLKKYTGQWGFVIYDECHHITDTTLKYIRDIIAPNNILLSATVTPTKYMKLQSQFHSLYRYSISTKDAIQNNILPNPEVFLLPLTLDDVDPSFNITVNHGKKSSITVPYKNRWLYLNKPEFKDYTITFKCTAKEWYKDLCEKINWYKQKSYIIFFANKHKQSCLLRLKWLSHLKESTVQEILEILKDKRTLTLCCTQAQTEVLGKNFIHSGNKKEAMRTFEMFQNKEINHITACDMLNESVNLVDCQYGVFASLHSSNIMIAQRNGRLLRHSKPIFIIPYYRGTREEEIVSEMVKDYNPDMVHVVPSIQALHNKLHENNY